MSETPYPRRVDWKKEETPDLGVPAISTVLYIVGVLALAAGALALYGATQDSGNIAQSEATTGIGSLVAGFLLFGLGFGLHKLHQIEVHLRRNPKD